ncbi:hypothetical protein OPV22_004216 [Ensete ventricosum]|uniref:Uncharacterized protein n=1 Tax=Ensete ventricosum TaxID=4639 RepID=A0AAV8S2S6_ENSVE|nr:hypothetical protein OPV22_004216 [Ensete ventricosum]
MLAVAALLVRGNWDGHGIQSKNLVARSPVALRCWYRASSSHLPQPSDFPLRKGKGEVRLPWVGEPTHSYQALSSLSPPNSLLAFIVYHHEWLSHCPTLNTLSASQSSKAVLFGKFKNPLRTLGHLDGDELLSVFEWGEDGASVEEVCLN